MTFRQQLTISILTAVATFIGVLVANWLSSRRESRSRRDSEVARLRERHFELYQRHLRVLDANADAVTERGLLDESGVTLVDTHNAERDMQLLASHEVLTAAELYRSEIRTAAHHWASIGEDGRAALRRRMDQAADVLMAAMRADLMSFGSRSRRLKEFKRLLRGLPRERPPVPKPGDS